MASDASSKLQLAALLSGPERARVLRALARLIVEQEEEEQRMRDYRAMVRDTGRRR